MLIGHHLGLKGKLEKLLQEGNEKAIKLNDIVNDLVQDAERNGWIDPVAAYQFFPAQSDGNKVIIFTTLKTLVRSLKRLNFLDKRQNHIFA